MQMIDRKTILHLWEALDDHGGNG